MSPALLETQILLGPKFLPLTTPSYCPDQQLEPGVTMHSCFLQGVGQATLGVSPGLGNLGRPGDPACK